MDGRYSVDIESSNKTTSHIQLVKTIMMTIKDQNK